MQFDKINALSTAIIAFAMVLGLITVVYYYLRSFQTKKLYIWSTEILMIMATIAFIVLMERVMEK